MELLFYISIFLITFAQIVAHTGDFINSGGHNFGVILMLTILCHILIVILNIIGEINTKI